MEFVVLIAVLVFRFLLGLMPAKRHDRWFYRWDGRVATWFKPKASHQYDGDEARKQGDGVLSRINPGGRFVFSVLFPVIGLSLVMVLLEPFLWGVPAFALSVLVLMYSLGRKESEHWLTRFQIAWRQRDLQGAYQYASEVIPSRDVNSEQELHEQVFSRLIRIRFEDFFLVTFWFMLLGAEGALLVRLFLLFSDNENKQGLRVDSPVAGWRYALEWPVTRLLGVVLMLAGHFVFCSKLWLANLLNYRNGNEDFLTELTLAAMGVAPLESTKAAIDPENNDGSTREEQLDALDGLMNRSAIIWVIAISLIITLI